ncbi:hypothetical protein GCM10010169_41950 [Micromonospora fulviviridis]|uniref:hypothetical protein n=1 Tax=Micromonospora fulviviridis TaxID=47860 RepID=UPI001663BC30|nr:hypothetical protein [Micromonospora fulviviridis]GGR93154.1 hypothetical protein GCM10010169_41950 [Micromonospora fulviviridis]
MSEPQDATVPDVPGAGRRWLLPAAGLAAALAVVLAVVVVTGSDPERPVARVVAAPTSLPPTTAAATPSAAGVPVVSPTPIATPTRAATPTRRPAPARSTAGAPRPRATTSSPRVSCTPAGVVDVVQVFTDGQVKVAARTDGEWSDQLCPGERIRVFWATYRRTADGGATLYRSQVRYLDRSSPTWTMQLVLPDTCGPWYVASGAWSIPQTLKPGVVPFGRGKLNWETAEHC